VNRRGFRWTIALGSLGLCVFVVVLGANLLPTWSSATRRSITPQLVLTWLMIASTSITALILALYLIGRGDRRLR
jgi:hypothetical protein